MLRNSAMLTSKVLLGSGTCVVRWLPQLSCQIVSRKNNSFKISRLQIVRATANAATVEAHADTSQTQQQAPDGPVYKANIDFKFVRDNLDLVTENCSSRGAAVDPRKVVELYIEYVRLQQETDRVRNARNENSSAMKVNFKNSLFQCFAGIPDFTHVRHGSVRELLLFSQLLHVSNARFRKIITPIQHCIKQSASGSLFKSNQNWLYQGKLEPEKRQQLIENGKQLKEQLESLEADLVAAENDLQREGQRLPNLTHPDAPIGGEENATVLKMVCHCFFQPHSLAYWPGPKMHKL